MSAPANTSSKLLDEFLATEKLPESYLLSTQRYFLPFIDKLEQQLQTNRAKPWMLGINGAQGTGKSTFAKLIEVVLTEKDYRIANLSIDDFYLSRAARQVLGERVHPLLASRGVPGTHDVALALQLLDSLAANHNTTSSLPRFDKAIDDVVDPSQWSNLSGHPDLIILEGWFVGVEPQLEDELIEPLNDLERIEDNAGEWRRYVNKQLAGSYQELFAKLDQLAMLKAPAFEQVFQWRSLQEQKLAARAEQESVAAENSQVMNEAQLSRFIQHFERLTRHCLAALPSKADQVFTLDADHQVVMENKNRIEAS